MEQSTVISEEIEFSLARVSNPGKQRQCCIQNIGCGEQKQFKYACTVFSLAAAKHPRNSGPNPYGRNNSDCALRDG